MPLPSSGTISLDQMHVEAGGTSGTQCSINDSDIRDMISKGSGVQMSFNEWYGASAGPIIEDGGGGDPIFWSGGGFGTSEFNFPSTVKAWFYQLSGPGWGIESYFATCFGYDNGNGWGTGITGGTTVYSITIDGTTYNNHFIAFNPCDPVFGSTAYASAICDWFSYSHMHGGGSYSQSGREPNHHNPFYDQPNNQMTTTVQAVVRTNYPYYGPVGGWYYTFKEGDAGILLSGSNYGGYACEVYRSDSPTYPF